MNESAEAAKIGSVLSGHSRPVCKLELLSQNLRVNLNSPRPPEPEHWLDPLVAQARRRLLRSWQVTAITDAIADHPGGSQLGSNEEVAEAVKQALTAAAQQFPNPAAADSQFEAFVRTMILDLLRAT